MTSLLQVSSLHFVLELCNRQFLTYTYWRVDADAGLLVHISVLVSSVTNCIASEISVPSVIFHDSNFFLFLKFAGVFRIREFYEFFYIHKIRILHLCRSYYVVDMSVRLRACVPAGLLTMAFCGRLYTRI